MLGSNWLERHSLRSKLLLGFSVLIFTMLALGIGDLLRQQALLGQITQLYEKDLLGLANAKNAQAAYLTMGRELRQALITENIDDRNLALRHVAEQDTRLRRELAELRPRLIRAENMPRLVDFEEAYTLYKGNVDSASGMLVRGEYDQARAFVASPDFQATGDAVRARMEDVVASKENGARGSMEAALQRVARARGQTLALLFGGLLMGGGVAWWVVVSIRRPHARVRRAVEQLAHGQLHIEVPHQDFNNELGEIARSVQVLQKVAQEMEARNWQKSHLAQISAALQTAPDDAELARLFFSQLAAAIAGIGHGALYAYEEDARQLRLLGGYALPDAGAPQCLELGQGLAGQCALERAPIVLTDPPPGYLCIASALGAAPPRAIALFPLLRAERLLGVLELAAFQPLGTREQGLLDDLTPVLAMDLEILERAARSMRLLQETQRQAGELEAQKNEIQATEAWYRGVIDAAPDGLLIADAAGVIVTVNRQLERMFGYAAGDLVGQPVELLVPEAVRGQHPALRASFMQSGGTRAMTARDGVLQGRRKDGSLFPVDVGLSRLDAQGGRDVSVCASVRDVTARLAAEKALAESAERLDFALRGGNLGLWDWDVGAGRSRVNEIWATMLGYRFDEVLDEQGSAAAAWARLLHPDDAEEANRRFIQCIETPELAEYHAQFRMLSKTGEWRWILSLGRATERDTSGRALRIVGIHQDITERKQLQDEMARAKEAAEDATRAKSEFLANMSHEIRTPMNAIIGMSHLALQTPLDKKQRNYIEKVHRSGENLLGIINDILDFSKIEAGRMTLETVDFRLEDVMDHLANLVGLKADDKGLELLFDVADDVPTALRGDPLRLGQILVNLGNNAVKFTESGEVVVGVELVSEVDGQAELHFRLRDTGIGMTAEQLGRLFVSFSQADASTTRRYGGTGLGLAISKTLVELMHGRIWVDSTPGEGSTFHFQVRLGVQSQPRPRRMFRADELLGVRVLVVDDNASAREILSTMARSFGLEVDVAHSGVEALRMAAQADARDLGYDVVLMDWRMPGMDGVEAMHRLEAEGLKRTPTVIMVTAYGREEALGAAQQQGVTPRAVLTKPVTPSTLLEAVGEALGRQGLVETRAVEKADTHAQARERLRGARLLLVEDNDLNQELALDLLTDAGIEVVCAGNGQEALDLLARDARFDGVLMDCQMPVLDGYAATQRIRAQPALAALPVIAMTANAMAGDREKALAAGMCDHVPKPLNVGSMFTTLAKWIRPAAGRPVRAPHSTSQPAAAFPSLPGIDTARGLATAGGKPELYRRLLLKFQAGQAGFAAAYAAARADASDMLAARRVAHTLRGTAGNIGALGLQAAAAWLEDASGPDPGAAADAALAEVLDQLAPVLASLAEFAVREGGVAAAASPVVVDEARLRQGLARLSQLLSEGDIEAVDLAEALLAQAGDGALARTLQRVAKALSDFDFDTAAAALQALEPTP